MGCPYNGIPHNQLFLQADVEKSLKLVILLQSLKIKSIYPFVSVPIPFALNPANIAGTKIARKEKK